MDSRLRSGALGVDKKTRPPTWTKRAKYEGQATFSLKDNMAQLPTSKPKPSDEGERWSPRPPYAPRIASASISAVPRSLPLTSPVEFNTPACEENPVPRWLCDPASPTTGLNDVHEQMLGKLRQVRKERVRLALGNRNNYYEPCERYDHRQDIKCIWGAYTDAEMRAERPMLWLDDPNEFLRVRPMCKQIDYTWKRLEVEHKRLLDQYADLLVQSQNQGEYDPWNMLAGKFHMPSELWHRGIVSFLKLYRVPGSRSHMISFVKYALDKLAYLIETLPQLFTELSEMRSSLSDYLFRLQNDKLRPLRRVRLPTYDRNGGILDTHTPNPMTYDIAYTGLDDPDDAPDWRDLRSSFTADFEPFYAFRYSSVKDPRNWDPLRDSLGSSLTLSEPILDTLLGWLYYGQAILADRFGVYCKVFDVLSLAARPGLNWADSLLTTWLQWG